MLRRMDAESRELVIPRGEMAGVVGYDSHNSRVGR